MILAVFDIGGSHISVGAVDCDSACLIGEMASSKFSDQPGDHDALQVLLQAVRMIRSAYGTSLSGLSIAVPNPFDHVLGISRMKHKLVSLYGIDLRRMLSEVSGVSAERITFTNDADAFLLGALRVTGITTGRSVGITLGTGIGSAFAIGETVISEGKGVPPNGEIWDLPYRSATVEESISTRRLEADYVERTQLNQSVKLIAESARAGNQEAISLFADFGARLAKILEVLCASFDPERVIIGGGIAAAGDIFMPEMSANAWCRNRVSILQEREVVPLLGAASAWQSSLNKRLQAS